MSAATLALSLVAAGTAAATIGSDARGARAGVYVCKPLTTALILAVALLQGPAVSEGYRALVVAGLAFSLAGDVFLMLPKDRFLAGLASFGVAHLLYIAAFTATTGPTFEMGALAPFAVYGAALVFCLWPHFGRMRVPALVYSAAILAMGWRAAEQWVAHGETWSLVALVGAVLFAISDSALAWDRFRRPLPHRTLLVLSTYYAGQLGIALSVGRG